MRIKKIMKKMREKIRKREKKMSSEERKWAVVYISELVINYNN